MVEKMKLANIMGNIYDIDRVIHNYIAKHEIQLEYATKELSGSEIKENCMEDNPYNSYVEMAEKLISHNRIEGKGTFIDEDEAKGTIVKAAEYQNKNDEKLSELVRKEKELESAAKKLNFFDGLDFDISTMKDLEFVKYHFGRTPVLNFKQFEVYVYSHEDVLFVESKRDKKYVYGVYFVPNFSEEKTETVLDSLNFESIEIPFTVLEEELFGTFEKAYNMVLSKLESTRKELSKQRSESVFAFGINERNLLDSYFTLSRHREYFELRKYAAKAHTHYFIFVGWISEREAARMQESLENDNKVIFILEESTASTRSEPPSKLKNNFFARPFEFFVKMYGLPKYDEIDPTPIVAVTYFILFGMMFGDLGQGFVIAAIGYLLAKFKKMALGSVMVRIGISSMIFGCLYGSVFGLEHLIPTFWIKPAENINSVLVLSVGMGMVLVLIAMCINMINAVRKKDRARLLIGPNGLSGLIFYAGIISLALSVFFGSGKVSVLLIIIFIVIPLLIICFKEPIHEWLEKGKVNITTSKGMYFLEMFIELFEVMLTYFTNTVSFVRVGAFALSHAGMMSVVLLLAETSRGGLNPVVMVLGNILVMFMEALVVGIQVLRIEFYELFSRYYEGGGREFIPTVNNVVNNKER